MRKLKVGLVGLAQARHFIDIFNSYSECEVTAICDTNQEILNQVGDQYGIAQRFTDYKKFVESDIDIVELSTPIPVHGQQSILALKNGKHVLCQYIAANNPEEGEELLRAWEDSGGKKYMFIETDCYERKNRIMMELARRGVFGELIAGRGEYLHYCGPLGRNADGSLTWRGQMWMQNHGGNILAVHTTMPLLELFGERVKSVFAMGPGSHTMPEFLLNDLVVGLAKLPSGRMLELQHAVLAYRPGRCGYYLQGTRGCFEYDRAALLNEANARAWLSMQEGQWMSLDELVAAYDLQNIDEDRDGHMSSWAMCIQDFMSAVLNDTPPRLGLHDALHITAIGWAAEQSMRTGQVVDVIQYD
jgi:predicted dehydrogenase